METKIAVRKLKTALVSVITENISYELTVWRVQSGHGVYLDSRDKIPYTEIDNNR